MTNAELAVLSLVLEGPQHGYLIEQTIEQREMRQWTEIGFSSIYYLLKKLERHGLVKSNLQETDHGPARRVYQATLAGEDAHHTAVLEALEQPQRCFPTLQLGLANLPCIDGAEARCALREYRETLGSRLRHLEKRRMEQQPLADHIETMFDYSKTMVRAELGWISGFLDRLEESDEED